MCDVTFFQEGMNKWWFSCQLAVLVCRIGKWSYSRNGWDVIFIFGFSLPNSQQTVLPKLSEIFKLKEDWKVYFFIRWFKVTVLSPNLRPVVPFAQRWITPNQTTSLSAMLVVEPWPVETHIYIYIYLYIYMSNFGSFRPELWEATNQQNNMNHSFGMCNFPCKPT